MNAIATHNSQFSKRRYIQSHLENLKACIMNILIVFGFLALVHVNKKIKVFYFILFLFKLYDICKAH